MSSNLFKPLKLGNIQLQHRLVMAPMTRFRADDEHVPLPFVAEYYAQRASTPGTLLITEGTFIAPKAGGGNDNVPGIWNEAQIAGWKKVADAVHAKGSFIFVQVWALGRAAELEDLQKELGPDAKVVSASDILKKGGDKPMPLTEEKIKEYISFYAEAAKNAIAAGFDGVEVHNANGYLPDQFLQDVSNIRIDAWDGSIENRARFGIEIAKAIVEAIGTERTGELKKLKLAYIHVVNLLRDKDEDDKDDPATINFLVDLWDNQSPVLIAGGYEQATARKPADEGFKEKDVAIVFGHYFISNPDLVFRIQEGIDFTPADRSKYYNPKQEDGYTTWPFSKEWEARFGKL
ncbi:FMN-linked oxidoreductase [Stipitochalara longipes BDJ]|nr:FMN-linked oxidoreductase [Stipitochalara longipes BDJ]